MGKVPSLVVDLPPEFKTDRYLPYNKIYSTLAWIQKEHANLPPDQIVVIMDVDIVLIEDLSYIAVDVGKVEKRRSDNRLFAFKKLFLFS